jgi:hypothetical protein
MLTPADRGVIHASALARCILFQYNVETLIQPAAR